MVHAQTVSPTFNARDMFGIARDGEYPRYAVLDMPELRELHSYNYDPAQMELADGQTPRDMIRSLAVKRLDRAGLEYGFICFDIDKPGEPVYRLNRHTGTLTIEAMPAIGGGSHDHTPTPSRATSQKRDNQRAERAAERERYHNAATERAADMSAIIADMDFTVAEQRDSGDTAVTIWHDADGLATIKQTPYTVRIYNGRPARLGKKADAVFVNRVACGWNPDYTYTPNGHAEGIAAFIAAHITYDETSDYAYIDTGEQSPALDTPTGSTVATDTGAIIATGSHIDLCAFMPTLEELANGTAVYAHACKVCGQSTGSTKTHYCADHQPNPVGALLTVDASGNRYPVTFDASAYQYPTISGGSHDNTPENTMPSLESYCSEGHYQFQPRCNACEIALCSGVISDHESNEHPYRHIATQPEYIAYIQRWRDRLAAAVAAQA